MLSKDHYVDLVDGKFAGTSREDLRRAFEKAATDPDGDNLVIHVHGGLVSRKSAMDDAEALLPFYREAGAFPLFVCWNSDLWTTLSKNLDEIAADPIFTKLIKRLVRFVVSKLFELPGNRSAGEVEHADSWFDMPDGLKELQDYAEKNSIKSEPSAGLQLNDAQIRQFKKELKSDPDLKEISRGIAASMNLPGTDDVERGGGAVAEPVESCISEKIKKEIRAEAPRQGDRSAAVFLTLAKYGAEVLVNVMKRFARGTDHGAYTTAVEELLRTLYIDDIGGLGWKMMKKDTSDAFADAQSGGTVMVELLSEYFAPKRRITLVGHSTGAVFIAHLLDALDTVASKESRVDVVFLAAACSMPFIGKRLDIFKRRVEHIRCYGLSDPLESGYWEVPAVYPRSLLYLVSGLLEVDQIDMPLVGMERYFSRQPPYDDPTVKSVADYLDGELVWAVDEDIPGRESTAKKHGGFFLDPGTQRSLNHLLTRGFD